MKINNLYFITLVILTLIISFLSKELLNTDQLIVNSLAERLTSDQLHEAITIKEKWQWVGYMIIPLLLIIKVSIIAAILDVGLFFFEKEIKYKTIYFFVTKAEFIFLGVIILKTIWFYVFQVNYTLEDLQYFYPLSILNILDYKEFQPWFIYPLQVLNLFELAYWFILAYLLGKELKGSIYKGLSIVASSYGVLLIIWIISVMFFTLNMS